MVLVRVFQSSVCEGSLERVHGEWSVYRRGGRARFKVTVAVGDDMSWEIVRSLPAAQMNRVMSNVNVAWC